MTAKRCSASTPPPPDKRRALLTTLSSSLTLPGQEWRMSRSRASLPSSRTGLPISRAASLRNLSARKGTSPLLSLSVGRATTDRPRRAPRSSRSLFSSMSVSTPVSVAAMMRTSTSRAFAPPAGYTVFSSMALRSFSCTAKGMAFRPFMKIVPPPARSKAPDCGAKSPPR